MIPRPNMPIMENRLFGVSWDQCALFPGESET